MCLRSKITITVSEVLKILLKMIFRSMFEKSCKKKRESSIASFYLHLIAPSLTWSVTLLFRGSPPNRSNCTKPNIIALMGISNNPQAMLLRILSTTVYSSTSMEREFQLELVELVKFSKASSRKLLEFMLMMLLGQGGSTKLVVDSSVSWGFIGPQMGPQWPRGGCESKWGEGPHGCSRCHEIGRSYLDTFGLILITSTRKNQWVWEKEEELKHF